MKSKKLIIENLNSADKYLKETKANLLEMKRLIDCTKKNKREKLEEYEDLLCTYRNLLEVKKILESKT